MASTSPNISRKASHEFYASCPEGFEVALADELRGLGLRQVRRLKGRVTFVGPAADAYRACLWSRLASRIFVTLARFDARDADELYENAAAIAWEHILRPGATLAVAARGTSDELRNSHFSALRVKDAVCDRLARVLGERPSVDTDCPDCRLSLTIRGDRASLQLDLSGDPLFKRLPREATRPGAAHVLRPDYAALALAQVNWQQTCANALVNTGDAAAPAAENDAATAANRAKSDEPNASVNSGCDLDAAASEEASTHSAQPIDRDSAPTAFPVLIDLCCAGGGITLEAASVLAGRAPGIDRERWGFFGWAEHDEAAWTELHADALAQAERARGRAARIVATDLSGDAVSCARRVLKAAGLADRVIFAQPDAEKILRKLSIPVISGATATGGIVLDTTEVALTKLPRLLALVNDVRDGSPLPGSGIALDLPIATLTRDAVIEQTLGTATNRIAVMPNNEEAQLLTFAERTPAGSAPKGEGNDVTEPRDNRVALDLGDGAPCPVFLPESDQFARRLRKVAKLRRKWAQREGVTCYRVYDADLPDYSAAIDLYEGSTATPGRWLVIAEYAAPRSVDPALAEKRLLDMLAIAPRILDVEPENVFAKARIRSRGGSQYGKQAGSTSVAAMGGNGAVGARKGGAGQGPSPKAAAHAPQGTGAGTPSDIRTRRLPLIEEGGLTFAVNFNDYLDTGIFLDHRITRSLVREHARGKRFFLNLFAYTGTATCYAADAGVEETVTVDLSNTYLDWAERNMEQNGFVGPDHHYVRADVMSWIRDMRATRNRWDLIFCDPPTFSNSSKMGRRTWDVQRDHVELLVGLSRLLSREGEAIFSCNLRTFRPDTEELARAGVVLTDITAQTIPEDFARNKKIHHCYLVRRYTSEEAMRMVGMDEEAIRERTRELRSNAERHGGPTPKGPSRNVPRRDGAGHGGSRNGSPRNGVSRNGSPRNNDPHNGNPRNDRPRGRR